MDFEIIALTKSELAALKKSSKKDIPVAENQRLIRLDLIYETRTYVPGRAGTPTGYAKITDRGTDYLIYIANKQREQRISHWHDWKIALLSTIGGALLSQPLWDLITVILHVLQGD